MKGYRVLGGLMFGLGCAIAFVGLLAFGLPLIDNRQLQLVLASFAMPSRSLLVSAVNSVMTFALRSCYLVMAIGAALAALGACLMLRHSPHAATRQPIRSPHERPPQERRTARPPQTNRPARPVAPSVNKAKQAVRPSADENITPNPFIHYTNQPIDTQRTPFSSAEATRASAYAPPEDWTKPLIPGAADAPPPASSASAPKPAQPPEQAPEQAMYQPTMGSVTSITETSFAPIVTAPVEPPAPSASAPKPAQPPEQAPEQAMYQPTMGSVTSITEASFAPIVTAPTEPPAPAPDDTPKPAQPPEQAMYQPTMASVAAIAHSPSNAQSNQPAAVDEPAAPEAPPAPPPPRIRSTMGRHS